MTKLFQAALLTAAATVVAVGGVEAQELTIEPVKDGLYTIFGPGGNVGVRVTSEGVILVDDKFPQNYEEIQRLVDRVSDQPVRIQQSDGKVWEPVINTHHHGDHAGSNPSFLAVAEVIAHRNARNNMLRGGQDGLPRLVFTNETSVHLGGVEVQAYYMGTGHTDGDVVVYYPELRTVLGGDLLHGTAPFIDYANGGSSAGWVGTLNNILQLDFDTAIPGHGGIMARDEVVAFRNQMEAVRGRMMELVRGGLRRAQAPERIVTSELSWTTAEQGLFMQRSIPGFYDEIAAEVR